MSLIDHVKLGSISEIITKGTTPTTLGYDFQREGINFLKVECFDESGRFIPDKVAFISRECNEKLKRSQLKKGDILFSIAGAIGRVSVVTENMLPANTNQALAIIRIKEDNLYLPYIQLILNSQIVKRQLEKKKQGVAQLNISLKDVSELTIPIPQKETQIKYAKLFEKISMVIRHRKKQLKKFDELIKARFVELFGDLMENPFNWPMKTIADVSLFLKSGLSRKLSDEDIGLPVIRSGNIQNGQFIFDNVKYWYKDDPQGANTKDYVLEDGDVLVNFINSSSQIGKTAIYRDTGRDCIYTTNIFRMKLADNCNEYYYNWFAMSDYYYRHLQNIIQPAVNQSSFTTVNFLKLPIPLPAKDKQNEFAEFVKQVDKSKVAIQKSLAETQLLFDKLMQDYFG